VQVGIGLNLGEINFFFVSCSHHVVVLHCTKNYCTKAVYFSKVNNHSLYDLY
jgi:hypothetical protein